MTSLFKSYFHVNRFPLFFLNHVIIGDADKLYQSNISGYVITVEGDELQVLFCCLIWTILALICGFILTVNSVQV